MGGSVRSKGISSSTLEALARAACPPEDASDDVVAATVTQTARLIERLPLPLRLGLRAAAWTLEIAPTRRRFGRRRFSSLDAPEGRAALTRLEHDNPRAYRVVRLLRDLVVFCYYEQPSIRSAVGYDPDPFIATVARARYDRWAHEIDAHRDLLLAPHPLHRRSSDDPPKTRPGVVRSAREIDEREITCDVVVVGSGAGGAVVAAELAEAGLSVLVLEEGGHHPTETFTTNTAQMLETLYRDCGISATLGQPPIAYAEGRCVGGSTVVNGAMAFRAPQRILSQWARESGVRELADGALDAAYERVERFLSVSTQDPGSIGVDQELLRRGASALGWRVIDNRRAQVHCGGCNVCTWGCPTGAKQSTLVSYLPRAMTFGAHVLSDCRVQQIVFEGKKAVGVRTDRGLTVHASHVVIACGAIQTPALLQRSGVRSPSGALGRNLSLHPGAGVVATFDEPVTGWQGTHQAYQVREFEEEGFLMAAVNLPPSLVARSLPLLGRDLGEAMSSYNHMVTAGVLVEDAGRGRVRAVGRRGAVATYRLNERDAASIVRSTLLLCEALLAAGARTIRLPFESVEEVRTMDDVRLVARLPIRLADIQAITVHLMGTARLGVDPTRHVCDPWGAVYDRAALSGADASPYPGPLGVNPMLTVQALATRVASRISQEWPR